MTNLNKTGEYLLKFDNSIGDCWVDTSTEGDPGRTTNIESATRYPSLRLAIQNKAMLEAIYNRKLSVNLAQSTRRI